MSGDKKLIELFDTNTDVYVYTGKIYRPDLDWSDKKVLKSYRQKMKQTFLGILYGLGRKTLSEKLNVPETGSGSAQEIIDEIYKQFPDLRRYVENQKKYVIDHKGLCNSMWGDILPSPDWKYVLHSNGRVDNNAKARVERHGVNLPIQGGLSTLMMKSFYHCCRQAKEDYKRFLPIINVHDSATFYYSAEKIFEVNTYCKKFFTEYAKQFGYHITLYFDLLAGDCYNGVCALSQVDENTITLKGSARNILRTLDKLDDAVRLGRLKYTCDKTRQEIEASLCYITDAMERFMKEKGTSLVMETSNLTVTLHRDWVCDDGHFPMEPKDKERGI